MQTGRAKLETVTYNRERAGGKLGQPDLTWASFWFDNNKTPREQVHENVGNDG